MWTTVVLVLTLIAFIFYRAAARPPGYPPGPLSLPLVGSLFSLLPNPKEGLMNLREKYGDVVSINPVRKWGIVIYNPTLMREAFNNPDFQGRIDMYLFKSRNVIISGKEDPLGILGTSGDVWKNQRRFTLRALKDQGFGKHSLEPIMQSELVELGQYLASKQKEKVPVGLLFNTSIINVIWAMVMGKRFSHGDKRLHELADKVNKMLQTFDPFNLALSFRIVKKLFPNLEIFKKVDGYMKDLLHFIEEQMTIYEADTEEAEDNGSYIGVYLREMKECALQNKETPLHMNHLKANILELFIAGSETTASTLWWSIYFLASNPEVQLAIQEELDRVIGTDDIPNLGHIDKVPYTTAAIYEVQRLADLVPFAIPHETTADTTIAGYKLLKGTQVMFHLSSSMRDPKYWKHPDKFYPEHFLTSDGKPHKPEAFMPFGHGKRVCLGESLARIELFLFFTNLVHRFSWKLTEDPVTWEKSTIITRPPNCTVYVEQREATKNAYRCTA
ncbi:cytochrome P450 2B1-like [Macrobrachium rosenbergii]|uniref:cytochrome P450 2B1-like n=1 Tax=Macrobrachium rosenbergii TaxID=79674 RepID=UPI0034D3EA1B